MLLVPVLFDIFHVTPNHFPRTGRFATGKDTLMAAKQREASIENTSRQGLL